ncbi:MAG TPA: enoyl-CoA hydratase/isomerase family protein [Egibacteraceae bacterium]|nr:enoyl-CoA hydratase/isomerase family protein [Egibacteraceae bacterium]
MDVVVTERQGRIAVIRLDRPPVNAMDTGLLSSLILALEAYAESDARAAVLTADGGVFCAGVDLRMLLEGGPEYVREFLPLLSECFAALFTVPKPVIAAVNGHALAGGCILAAACDLRLMADGPGTIGVTELPVGVPFPSWALEIMRHATAPQHLGEVVLTGRRYTPAEGLARGLLDEVVAPERLLDRALELAEDLARVPHATFAHTKRQLRHPAVERVERHGPDYNALAEGLWAAPEVTDAIRAYLEARVGRSGSRKD